MPGCYRLLDADDPGQPVPAICARLRANCARQPARCWAFWRRCAAGCATLGNPPAVQRRAGEGLLATSQSNLTSLGEVIDKHPDDPQAYNMRGTVYGEAGRDDQALADFNKAISLDPNYAQAYANRALIYRKTDRLDLALADDNKALAHRRHLRAGLSRPRHRLPRARPRHAGARRFQQGDRAAARQCRRLLQSRPALSEPAAAPVRHRRFLDRHRPGQRQCRAVGRARAELSRDRRQQVGGDDLDQAVQLDPLELRAWTSRGLAYERLGAQGQGRRLLCQGAQYQRQIRAGNGPASPASAARSARPIRRFEDRG